MFDSPILSAGCETTFFLNEMMRRLVAIKYRICFVGQPSNQSFSAHLVASFFSCLIRIIVVSHGICSST